MSLSRRMIANYVSWALLCFVALTDVSAAHGKESTAEAADGHGEDRQKDQLKNKEESEAEQAKRRQAVGKGMAALAGIVIVGLSLMALVWFWGHRVRRTARTPLPEQTTDDSLWYLKNKEPVEAEVVAKETPESSTDTEPDES